MSLLALAVAGGAQAQTAYAPGPGFPLGGQTSITVPIKVTASVGGSCGFVTAPNATRNFVNLDGGFTTDVPFELNCNGASRLAVVSANGGLLTSAAAVTGYTNLAPYNVALRMVGNTGAPAEASCAVENLKAGGSCSFRGTADINTTGLRLGGASTGQSGSYVRISAPAYSDGTKTLVASTGYSDTLIVTLSASL